MRTQLIKFSRLSLAIALAIGTLFGATRNTDAAMEDQLRVFGKKVAAALKDDGHNSVRLDIKGPAAIPGSSAAMVREVIATELTGNAITVARLRAPVTLVGKMRVIELPKGAARVEKLVLQLTLDFVDRNDSPILSLDSDKINILEQAEIAKVLGLPFEAHPGDKTPDGSAIEGNGEGPQGSGGVVDGFVNPQQDITGQSVIRARRNGEFGLEIIANGIPRAAKPEEGLAFVNLHKDDRCTVKLINDADYEVAVQLTLDGVDSFWFTPKRSGLWIVPPHQSLVVKGWQLNAGQAREFRIVPFERSVAAKLNLPNRDAYGVIAATYYRAYQVHETIPLHDRPRQTKRVGVGTGDVIDSRIKFVNRKLGKARATVPVRYEKPIH